MNALIDVAVLALWLLLTTSRPPNCLRFQSESKQLRLRRREDAIRDIVARAILECAQRRIRAPIEMRQCARDVLQIA